MASPSSSSAMWMLCFTAAAALLLAALTGAAPARSPKCPSRCVSCDGGVAECSRRSLVSPPRDFPRDLRRIILDGNHVRILGARSFPPMKNLEVLRMKNNKVRVVKSGAFKKLGALMTLDLSNNRLVKVYGKGLEGLDNLQTLSLQYNRLRSAARIFDYTPKLYQLNLAFNRLRALGKNDFRTPTRIHYLDLRKNAITTIHPQAFANLKLLRYLFLNQNPLVAVPDLTFGSRVLQLVDFSNCRLTHVPRTMPDSVSDFRLSDNKIMQINDSDFTNMTNLRLLALNNNELHFVANKAFRGLGSLEEVWLRNNRLVYIPRGLPDTVRKLYMDSNKIRVIEAGLFSNASRLDYLTVENNRIQRVHNDTFAGLRFLRSLNFQGNRLRVIEAGTFDTLGNLTTLSLANNPLEEIEEGAFVKLGNLTFLHLDMCGERTKLEHSFLGETPSLKQLSMMNSPGLGKAFAALLDTTPIPPLKALTEIDLTYNDLETLSPNVREAFPSLRGLALDGNPWACDKRLTWLHQWMATSDVSFSKYEPVVCERPHALKGRPVREVAEDDFAEVAPTPPPPSEEDYSKMMARKQAAMKDDSKKDDDSSSSSSSGVVPSPAAMHDDSAVMIGPKLPRGNSVDPSAAERKRKSRRRKNRRQRKVKGKGRKKRGKSGKGRKRRNRRNRKSRELRGEGQASG